MAKSLGPTSAPTPIVTTFAPLVMQAKAELARQYNVPEWKIAERQKTVADGKRFAGLQAAAKAGIVIGFGTDAGSPVVPHSVVAPEMEFMIHLRIVKHAYAAIRSATSVAAGINKLGGKVGMLKPGFQADVIVVEGKPDQKIAAIEKVQMTLVGGKRMVG
jgi:imidazolonepropionase-like amidohydrolase